jgi:hypothetical protein
MKATDLRIGNLVTQIIERSTHNEEKTITIEWQELMWISRDRVDFYKPIPLTEEWFVKFGFTLYNKENPIMFKGVVFIEQRQKTLIGTQFFTFHFDGNTIKIQYIHQLQNLYFALTNEELTLVK